MGQDLCSPEPLTQSSITFTHQAQTSAPKAKTEAQRMGHLPQVAVRGLWGEALHCSNHSGLQVAAGGAWTFPAEGREGRPPL